MRLHRKSKLDREHVPRSIISSDAGGTCILNKLHCGTHHCAPCLKIQEMVISKIEMILQVEARDLVFPWCSNSEQQGVVRAAALHFPGLYWWWSSRGIVQLAARKDICCKPQACLLSTLHQTSLSLLPPALLSLCHPLKAVRIMASNTFGSIPTMTILSSSTLSVILGNLHCPASGDCKSCLKSSV